MQLDTTILAPAAALAGWTMIVFLWMLSRRLPAFAAAGINLAEAPAGMRGGDSEAQMPAKANWLEEQAVIDLVVVPGIAFDRRGHRIGFGGGYYDRFLADLQAVKLGLCYDDLVLQEIPNESHDVPMDIVVAQTATYQGVMT